MTLIQLPPQFKKDYGRLEGFLSILPTEHRFAVEFRHPSWWRDETWRILRRYGVANTIVDEPLLPPEPIVTADFSFIRWHGRGRRPWYNYRYSVEELKPWIPQLNEVSNNVKEIYGYFNNHFHGYAVENCLQVLEMLGTITPHQLEAKRRVERYIQARLERVKKPRTTILEFTPEEKGDLEKALGAFLTRERFLRAKSIDDSEVATLTVEGLGSAQIYIV